MPNVRTRFGLLNSFLPMTRHLRTGSLHLHSVVAVWASSRETASPSLPWGIGAADILESLNWSGEWD